MGEGMEGPACRLRLSPKEADSMEEAHSRFGWRPGAVARGRARQVFDYPLLADPSPPLGGGRRACQEMKVKDKAPVGNGLGDRVLSGGQAGGASRTEGDSTPPDE